MSRCGRLVPILLIVLVGPACTPRPQNSLPVYPGITDTQALHILSEHGRSIRSVSAACLLTLTRPDGQSVRLDGAIVIAPPSHGVRLRAWKFSQALFDLTLTADGVWIEIPKDRGGRDRVLPATLGASQLARAVSLFTGDFFEGPGLMVVDETASAFRVRKPLDGGRVMTALVDRPTITVRRYELAQAGGAKRFSLILSGYDQFHGIAWSTTLDATSEGGRIRVELRDVELNGPIPPEAFIPPHGAEKLP